jgi:zinc protease
LLTALAIRAQDTAEMASLSFDQIVYQDHPYSRPEDGYPATIQAIRVDDLADFHRRHYGPHGMTLVITGGVEPQQAIEKAQRAFSNWHNPQQDPAAQLPELSPLAETVVKRITLPGKAQSDLLIGVAGPRRADPDYLAASLGNNILGQFGMMGRIGERVREEAGLAYYAASSLGGGLGPGPWDIAAGVAPENAEQAIALIVEELQRFTSEYVSREELEDSKAHYIGRLPVSLESNAGVAGALINIERHKLGLDYYQRYASLIEAVSREQILGVAQRFLNPDRLGIAIAGP